jgi:hypothetical protein
MGAATDRWRPSDREVARGPSPPRPRSVPSGEWGNIIRQTERFHVSFVPRNHEATFRMRESLMTVLSAVGGAFLLAIGSNFIVPIGSVVGGVCDLAGIASLMVFLGLLDGE